MKSILILFLTVLLVSPVLAESIFVAKGNVNVRADYPKAPFYRNAKIIGVIKQNDTVKVLSTKEVFIYEWLNVEYGTDNKIGWVYNGKTNDTSYFEKVEVD